MSSFRETFLAHASSTPYDAAARRERYLRERKLKGRPAGTGNQQELIRGNRDHALVPPKPPSGGKDKPSSIPVTPARIEAMKARLAQLKTVLAALVEQAKKDAGVESTTKTATPKKSADTKPEKKQTAAEKKEAAKKAKEQRDKEPPKPETASSVQAQIDSVQKQIEGMRAKLAAAKKAASAKKPPPKKDSGPDSKLQAEDDTKKPSKPTTASEGRHH